MQAPDYFAVMTYLDDAAARRQVYEAYSIRATEGEREDYPKNLLSFGWTGT